VRSNFVFSFKTPAENSPHGKTATRKVAVKISVKVKSFRFQHILIIKKRLVVVKKFLSSRKNFLRRRRFFRARLTANEKRCIIRNMSEQKTDLKKLIRTLSKRLRTEDPATFFADLDEFFFSLLLLVFAFFGVSLPGSARRSRSDHAFLTVKKTALPATSRPEPFFSFLFSSFLLRSRTCA